MRLFLVFLTLVVVFCQKMAITKKYTDYLKHHVSWEVVDYEDNIFRGWTMDEFKSILNTEAPDFDVGLPHIEVASDLPSKFTWDEDCLHSVKSEGSCGASWAFTMAGMLSDRCCISKGVDYGWLSAQELIDCDEYNDGCYGGSHGAAFIYMLVYNGLVDEECFPYKRTRTTCPTECEDERGWTTSHICKCNYGAYCEGVDEMMTCIQNGPFAATFWVEPSLTAYRSGIYKCQGTRQDSLGTRSVVIEGYDDDPECHWIARNSWGTAWGISGRIKIGCTTCGVHENDDFGNVACHEIDDP